MAKQNNELLIENYETCPIGFAPFLEVNATTFDLYLHDRDIDYGHTYKKNFKDILSSEVAQKCEKGKIKMLKY